MDIEKPLTLLGGLSPSKFMHRYWQKKPLLVRGAFDPVAPISHKELFALAARDDVESRLIEQVQSGKRAKSRTGAKEESQGWSLRHGPIARSALPPLNRPRWTVLVQGADLHHDGVHALMRQFNFLPDARLDDLMISYASDQGGVGPHFDSYDVFLLQMTGQRQWSIGRQRGKHNKELLPDMPVKILAHFEPEETFVVNPGDLLYLPPHYAHDGVAVGGACTTYSVGLRCPERGELGAELLARIAEDYAQELEEIDDAGRAVHPSVRYSDPTQSAVHTSAAIPMALQKFARQALEAALRDPDALARALGQSLTEPKPRVIFEPAGELCAKAPGAWREMTLDRRTHMLYDKRHIYINGEAFRASGRDARLMRHLADTRTLDAAALAKASPEALALLADWCEAGWLQGG
ncbi:MAG: AraC family ligand binding domain-containing protein [Burkholderiaceae bacterium]|jgi:50S ribosomal protein L16 3-hydroxylase|nr:AraC family ligand binding domain-containing protein [Burkholderiaceae bacterium]